MRILTKLTFAFMLTPLISMLAVAQPNSDLAGAYLFSFQWGGTEITLKQNGTFASASSSCTRVITESGRYSVSGNVIHFMTRKLSLRNFDDNKDRDVTTRKARKEYLETDEPFKPYSWELQIVRWGERIYLMDVESFGDFIEAINLGFEPRRIDGYRDRYGVFYLRVGDEIKAVNSPPPLPEEFLRDLLKAPVNASVVEVKIAGDVTIATIDRGSADGLRLNMPLVTTTNTFDYRPYLITSLAEHTAEVTVYGQVKVGEKFSTRVPDIVLVKG